jgi:hypothetical protein
LLWTFVPPSRPRLGAVVSSVVGKKGEAVQEFRTLVCCGWQWAGGCHGPCWGCGPWMADLVLLLASCGGRGWIWRLKVSSGQVPDPRATAICGHLRCFFSWFTKPDGDGASSTSGVVVSVSCSRGASVSPASGGFGPVVQSSPRASLLFCFSSGVCLQFVRVYVSF